MLCQSLYVWYHRDSDVAFNCSHIVVQCRGCYPGNLQWVWPCSSVAISLNSGVKNLLITLQVRQLGMFRGWRCLHIANMEHDHIPLSMPVL
jgi:hypothetical protein